MSERLGDGFEHSAGAVGDYDFPQIMGAGCAILDANCDGRLDLYFVNGASKAREADSSADPSVNCLLIQTSAGQWQDATVESGLGDPGYGMGVAVGDVNNDGAVDVFVTNAGLDRLYLNDGEGHFHDVSRAAGIDNPVWSVSACFVDFDRDGWLDLYITNYVDVVPRHCTDLSGEHRDYCSPLLFPHLSDRLFRNETGQNGGEPKFSDVTVESGIGAVRFPGLGVVSADMNGDAYPDIYVANDQTQNNLWINQRDGTFRDEAIIRGCAYDAAGLAQAGMGVAIGDLNRDTRFDLFLTHLEGESHACYFGGLHGYRDDAQRAGVAGASRAMTGFGVALVDLDLDGDQDVLSVNGHVKRQDSRLRETGQSAEDFWSPYRQRNQILINDGTGRLVERLSDSEPFTASRDVSRGLAVGDLNGDGWQDCLVSNTAARGRVYLAVPRNQNHWLLVDAVLPDQGGRAALGATVRVDQKVRSQIGLVTAAVGYASSSDHRVHFGLADNPRVDRIVVQWPDGLRESFECETVDRVVRLERGTGHAP